MPNVDELFDKYANDLIGGEDDKFMNRQDFLKAIAEILSHPLEAEVIKKNADGVIPCPYCGLYPTVDFRPSRRGVQAEAFVRCGKMICKVNPKTMIVKTKEQAIKIWNNRKC